MTSQIKNVPPLTQASAQKIVDRLIVARGFNAEPVPAPDLSMFDKELHRYIDHGDQADAIVQPHLLGGDLHYIRWLLGEQYKSLVFTENWPPEVSLAYNKGDDQVKAAIGAIMFRNYCVQNLDFEITIPPSIVDQALEAIQLSTIETISKRYGITRLHSNP